MNTEQFRQWNGTKSMRKWSCISYSEWIPGQLKVISIKLEILANKIKDVSKMLLCLRCLLVHLAHWHWAIKAECEPNDFRRESLCVEDVTVINVKPIATLRFICCRNYKNAAENWLICEQWSRQWLIMLNVLCISERVKLRFRFVERQSWQSTL